MPEPFGVNLTADSAERLSLLRLRPAEGEVEQDREEYRGEHRDGDQNTNQTTGERTDLHGSPVTSSCTRTTIRCRVRKMTKITTLDLQEGQQTPRNDD
ncbi:hypothetical protein [Actinophytocola glycyrrhizae]|uniref:Uncharacterized protein n=1 Tax=Actinophytocola glycyrrhizae TaxID=2044873 RepID=A0ABV9S0L2_9PSEU